MTEEVYMNTTIEKLDLNSGSIIKVIDSTDIDLKDNLFMITDYKVNNSMECCCINLKTGITTWTNPIHNFDCEVILRR